MRVAHIGKERGMPTHITHKDSTPEQLSKRPHSQQKQWQKSQHPRESNHIHGIEQGKPRGMKNRGQNNELQ